MSDDAIMVSGDNHCLACGGACTNEDPADYDHMMTDWEALSGAWLDRGATASDVWSFIASVLIAVARNNDVSWDEFEEILHLAWRKGDEEDGV